MTRQTKLKDFKAFRKAVQTYTETVKQLKELKRDLKRQEKELPKHVCIYLRKEVAQKCIKS